MRLKDKVAIVTGGGSGMGRAIALAYVGQGAKVAVADINMDAARETVAQIAWLIAGMLVVMLMSGAAHAH